MPVACIAPLDPEQCGRWPPYRLGRIDSTGVHASDKEPSGLWESLRFIVCTVRARTWIGSFFFQPLHPYDLVNACAFADMPVSRQGLLPDPPTTAGSKRRSRPVRHREISMRWPASQINVLGAAHAHAPLCTTRFLHQANDPSKRSQGLLTHTDLSVAHSMHQGPCNQCLCLAVCRHAVSHDTDQSKASPTASRNHRQAHRTVLTEG